MSHMSHTLRTWCCGGWCGSPATSGLCYYNQYLMWYLSFARMLPDATQWAGAGRGAWLGSKGKTNVRRCRSRARASRGGDRRAAFRSAIRPATRR